MASQDATQLEAVKAYIAKYNLEDELSNAVNQAIKLDSDDPFRVIADYLAKFAKARRLRFFSFRAHAPHRCPRNYTLITSVVGSRACAQEKDDEPKIDG